MRELLPPPQVFVVDDDPSLCRSLALVLELENLAVRTFHSAEDFLSFALPDSPCCAIIDMYLPGMTGLQLQETLVNRGVALPVIILTGHGEIPVSVQAIKSGAEDYLIKPVTRVKLLSAIQAALAKYPQLRIYAERRQQARERLQQLTQREREVMLMATQGASDKEIARRLNISHRTVEKHKSNLIHKTGCTKLLDLIALASDGGLCIGDSVVP